MSRRTWRARRAAVSFVAGLVAATALITIPTRATAGVAGAERCERSPVDLELRWPGAGALNPMSAPAGGPPPYSYLLYVPQDLPAVDVPLLVAMHGLGGSSAQFAEQSRWSELADEHKFIVVFPNGPKKWDFREASPDVTFLRQVIAEVRSARCVDGRRIWATGHSMGGFMAQRLACDAGDLVAAVASTAGGNVSMVGLGGACAAGSGQATPAAYEPVAVGLWHGTADQLISYENQGRATQRLWAERYQCDPEPDVIDVPYGTLDVHGRCHRDDVRALGPPLAQRFAVQFRTYREHRHGYPDGCGGLGEVSREPCSPDEAMWPTAASHNAEIHRFLTDHPRRTPAGATT